MAKRKKSEFDDGQPVAKRTHLMCATPLRTAAPVQYPREWVPRGYLHRHAHVENDGKRSYGRSSRGTVDLPSTSKEISVAGRRYSLANDKQIKSSFIQLVRVRSAKSQDAKRSRKARSRRGPGQRKRTGRRRKRGRKAYRRKLAARRRARRKGRAYRKRTVRRRRKFTTAPRRKRRVPRRLLRKAQELDRRKLAFTQCPPLGHEQDDTLCKQNKNTTRSLDVGREELLEDPLNVRNICRHLVKSMQGMPADARGSKENDDKADQQDLDAPPKEDTEKKSQLNRKRKKKSRNVHRSRRKTHRKHRKRHHRKSGVMRLNLRRLKRIIDKHAKRRIAIRRRKVPLRHAPKLRYHTKSQGRAKVVKKRQGTSRSAEVSRRRMAARKSRHQ